MPVVTRTWEAAEIARSAVEARLTPTPRLQLGRKTIARYMNPSPDSVYPLEYAYALLGDLRGKTVLDYGCGSGENALLLAMRGARVIALDISADLIGLARRRLALHDLAGAAAFIVGSAHDVPLESGRIDVVFGMAILHHLDLDAAAREVLRVLKPGGRAIFKEPVRDSGMLRAARRLVPYRAADVSPYERPLALDELRRFASGFPCVRTRPFSLPFVNAVLASRRFDRWVPRAHEFDARLLARMPALSRYAGVYVLHAQKASG